MPKRLLQFLIFVFFVLATFQPPVDLDLGWHLRYGQYFFQTGHVLKDNILSYVWQAYQWVQASWGYDLLVYQIFTHFGFLGLTLSGTLITLIIFWLIIKPIDRFSAFEFFFLAAVFLTQTDPLYATGLRSQTPSTLFFALVLVITNLTFSLSNQTSSGPSVVYEKGGSLRTRTRSLLIKIGTKPQFFLPFLFLLWANTHGGFTLGLAVVGIIWFGHGLLMLGRRLIHRLRVTTIGPRQWIVFGFILAASTLAPLVNPWGIRIYEETFKHSTTISLTGISEWMPLSRNPPAAVIAALVTLLVFFLALRQKEWKTFPYLLAFSSVTLLAFGAIRFLIPFGVMAVYFLANNLSSLKTLLPRWTGGKPLRLIFKVAVVLLVFYDAFSPHVYFVLPDLMVFNFTWEDYCNFMHDCSEDLTNFMHKNPPVGNGFNPYNYGGYLTWRVPQVKTFVDGRMSAWAIDDRTPPIKLNDQVVKNGGVLAFRELDNTYHFRWVIIQTPTQTASYLEALSKTGQWQKKYQDPYYSYFVRSSR